MTDLDFTDANWTATLSSIDGDQIQHRDDHANHWPSESIRRVAKAGFFRGFIPSEMGGWDWSPSEQMRALVAVSQADLPTAFAMTQLLAAIKRVATSRNDSLRTRWLEDLLDGRRSASVGISQLTTSGQHLDTPEMLAHRVDGRWRLCGRVPWITGAAHVDAFVVGAVCQDGRQILAMINRDRVGVVAGPGFELMAMTQTKTDAVEFHDVDVVDDDILDGPIETVLGAGGAGGLATSALAIGLAAKSASVIAEQSLRRTDLQDAAAALLSEVTRMRDRLCVAASEKSDDAFAIRQSANDLALRATQAELMAAKGAGFVDGHPAGKRCRQALFFLVWSCPKSVVDGHLCQWADGE